MSKLKDSQNALRIDYSKYEADEIVATVSDALLFPIYIGRVAIIVFIAFIIGFILLANTYALNIVTGIVFFLLSFIISLPSMVLVTVIRLIRTVRDDLTKVFNISVETTRHVYEDSILLIEQRKQNLPFSSTFKDVFKGVILYVILPSIAKVMTRKLKFFAPPFVFVINGIFKIFLLKKPPDFSNEEEVDNEGGGGEVKKQSIDMKIKRMTQKVTFVSFRVITLPIYFCLIIYGAINFLLVWLLTAIL